MLRGLLVAAIIAAVVLLLTTCGAGGEGGTQLPNPPSTPPWEIGFSVGNKYGGICCEPVETKTRENWSKIICDPEVYEAGREILALGGTLEFYVRYRVHLSDGTTVEHEAIFRRKEREPSPSYRSVPLEKGVVRVSVADWYIRPDFGW